MAARLALLAIPAALGVLVLTPVIVPAVLVGDDSEPTAVPTVTAGPAGCAMYCDEPAPKCTAFCDEPEQACAVFCDEPESVPACSIFCGKPEEVN
ncbi:hypothetical protein [Nocardia asteroides]